MGKRWCASASVKDEACKFVQERGYSPDVAATVVDSLLAPSSGVGASQVMPMLQQLAGRYEVGEDAGLKALADAVARELALAAGKATVRFSVKVPNGQGGHDILCEALEGTTLTEFALQGNGKGAVELAGYLECACSGVMACSTCQVYVETDWMEQVGQPDESEQDMIDLAHEPQPTSRLGCQIQLHKGLNGLVIRLPPGANNMFDDV
eukprot:gene5746-5680_t